MVQANHRVDLNSDYDKLFRQILCFDLLYCRTNVCEILRLNACRFFNAGKTVMVYAISMLCFLS